MKKALCICVLFIVLQGVAGIAVQMFINLLASVGLMERAVGAASFESTGLVWGISIATFVTDILMILFVYLLMQRSQVAAWTQAAPLPRKKVVALTVIIAVCLLFVLNGVIELFDVPNNLEEAFKGILKNPLGVLTISIVGPIAEEVCFRYGVMGSLLESRRFNRYALVISAALFGLIHFNPSQIVAAFILGLFMGWLYQKTGSLVLPIVCHILNNSLSTILAYVFGDATMLELFTSTTVFYASMAVVAIAVVLLLSRLNREISYFENRPFVQV